MAKIELSSKRVLISKANTAMVAVIAVGSFLTIFSMVASRALLSQRAYQARVTSQKEKARDQLKSNVTAVNQLVTSYKAFVETPSNVLGGNPNGTGAKDGDNARIVLDALPSQYDFPALATSLEKMLNGYKINSITGIDDELAQQNKTSPDPTSQEIPFEINVATDYGQSQKLISLFAQSIRPFRINKISFSGSQSNLTLDMTAVTYYQPAKNLTITKKEVQ